MSRYRVSGKVVNKWWLSRLIGATIAFIMVFFLVCYMIPVSSLSGYVKKHIDTQKTFTPEEFGLTATEFQVETSDGYSLKGEEFKTSGPSKGVVVLTPGLYNPVYSSLYGHVNLLLKEGYSVVIYQPRAHGDSEGKKVGHGISEVEDINAVIDYIRTFTSYLNLPVLLMGWNTGAAASINVAASNKYVNGVVAVGTYSNVHAYFSGILKNQVHMRQSLIKFSDPFLKLYLKSNFGRQALEISPDKSIRKIESCPVLLIHSTGDTFISSDESQSLYELSEGKAELWIRDTEDEYATSFFINLDKDPEYSKRLTTFFEKAVIKAESNTEE